MRKPHIFDVPFGERELRVHAIIYPATPDTREEPGTDAEVELLAVWEQNYEMSGELTAADRSQIELCILENLNES